MEKLGIVKNNKVVVKNEYGSLFTLDLPKNYAKYCINGFFIRNDMEVGIIYEAITGSNSFFVFKIIKDNNEIVMKIKGDNFYELLQRI